MKAPLRAKRRDVTNVCHLVSMAVRRGGSDLQPGETGRIDERNTRPLLFLRHQGARSLTVAGIGSKTQEHLLATLRWMRNRARARFD